MTNHPLTRAAMLCGTAVSLLAVVPAYAQELTEGEIISLDPIVVRDRDARGEAADRATAVYVSDAAVERASLGTAKELFEGLANVQVGGGIPLTQKVYVNGIDLSNLTTQIDGTLQNNRVFHHTGTNIFDPGMLKFVRVDPGIAAADTGPNAVAGAVTMETIDATDIVPQDQTVGGVFRLGYADNGDTFSSSLALGAVSDGFELLAYGRRAVGDDYTDGAGDVRQGTAANLQTGLLKVAYESDQGHRFELSGQRVIDSEDRNEKPNFGNWTPPYTMALVPYETERQSYSFRYVNTQGTAMWNPEVVFGYSESRVSRTDASYDGVSGTWSGKVMNTFYVGSGTITAGLDYYDKDSTFDDNATYRLEERAKNLGAFVQARFEPNDSWRISTGARYDTQEFTGVDDSEFEDSGASFNVSATYFVNENLSFRAGYSNVFGGYQIEDNYKFWTTDYSGLESSRGENVTLGVDWTSGSFTIGAEAFLTEITDARQMYWDRATASNLHNAVDVESKGFNIGATYGWGDGFARLTYTNSKQTVDGVEGGTYDIQHFGFGTPIGQRLALQVQHYVPQWSTLFGASLDLALENDSTAGCSTCAALDDYTVLNIFAEYTPPSLQNVSIRLSVDNLFDEDYSDRGTYGQDYPYDLVALKEPGRTVRLEAIARF